MIVKERGLYYYVGNEYIREVSGLTLGDIVEVTIIEWKAFGASTVYTPYCYFFPLKRSGNKYSNSTSITQSKFEQNFTDDYGEFLQNIRDKKISSILV